MNKKTLQFVNKTVPWRVKRPHLKANLRKTSLQRRVNVIIVRTVYEEALRGNPDIHLGTFTVEIEMLLQFIC